MTRPQTLLILLLLGACAQTPQTPGAAGSIATGSIGPGTLNVADAAIAGGDPDMALAVTQSVLAADPGNVAALIHEGDAYDALGRCPAAQAAYAAALRGDPKSSAAETGLGRCLLKTRPEAAQAAFAAAVRDDPGNGAAYNNLGIASDLAGNFPAAAAAYTQALAAEPGSSATEVNLGLSLALSGQAQAGLQYLGPLAGAQSATPKIREDYALALLAAGRDADARQVLAIDLPPDQVAAAIAGYAAVIGAAQPPATAPQAAAPPTTPVVKTAAIAATPLTQ